MMQRMAAAAAGPGVWQVVMARQKLSRETSRAHAECSARARARGAALASTSRHAGPAQQVYRPPLAPSEVPRGPRGAQRPANYRTAAAVISQPMDREPDDPELPLGPYA
jgi:hypothetical protein